MFFSFFVVVVVVVVLLFMSTFISGKIKKSIPRFLTKHTLMFKEELLQYRDSAVEHQFATLREIKAGKCDFNEFTITDMGPKGRGIMLKKPKRGLLIPYGGRLVASEQSEAKLSNSRC